MKNNYSRRDIIQGTIKLTGLAAITAFANACGAGKYLPSGKKGQLGGTQRYDIVSKLDLGDVDENDSRYVARGVEIFKERYMKVNTSLGDAMFKKNNANIVNSLEVDEKGKIRGKSSLEANNGLYFIRPVREGDGLVDAVILDEAYRKANMSDAKTIKKQGALEIFQMSEKNAKFGLEYVNIPGGVIYTILDKENADRLNIKKIPREPFFAVKVEEDAHDEREENFFNHYLIPVNKSKVVVDPKGIITIRNENRIFRPTFMSWDDMDSNIGKLEKDEQENARKQLEELKDGTYFSKAKNTTKKKE
jgi:hypothetical protein|tara:strand:- start:2669 stop:3583 length:915 start_codon:yes stop_codon:yes gene_type:complete